MLVGILTSLIAFFAYGGLLIPVYQKGIKGNRPSKVFSVYLLDMLILQAAYFGVSIAQNEQQALLWYNINIPLSSAQIIIYFYFVRAFLGFKQPNKLIASSAFIWLLIMGTSVVFHSDVITEIYRDPATGLYLPKIGPIAGILFIPVAAFLGATIIILAKNYRGKSRPQQTRIQYLILAIMIVWIGMALNVVPALRPYAIDVIANILSAFTIAYAILRYQLLELNTALRRMLESFVSLFVIGIGSTIVLYFFTKIANIGIETHILLLAAIISALTIIVLIPLRDKIQEFIGRTLFKTTHDGYLMIQKLSRTATSILDLKKLSNTILKDVVHTLDASWGALLLKRDSSDFQQIAWEGTQKDALPVLNQDHPILDWLSKPQEAVATYSLNEALEQNFLSEKQLRDLNLTGNELMIPLKTRDRLIGIMCLGTRATKRPYSQNDEITLLTLANNVASTIENARLYEAIQVELKERMRIEEALKENETIFSSFLEHSQVYVFFKDKNIRSIRLSKNYEQMLGMPIKELLGKTMDEIFPSELAKSMVADDLRILNEGQVVNVVEELDGRTYETTKFPIFKDGKPEMLAGITLDITERKRAEEKLKEANKLLEKQLSEIKNLQDHLHEQVIRDPLTGLFNRRYLFDVMERELARAARENCPISVLMVDIDHFKELNDTYGHQAGDEILVALSNLLLEGVRQGDIACRYGGDEFFIIMPGLNGIGAEQRAETIRHDFKNLRVISNEGELSAAISIGVAFYPQHGQDVNEIVKASDSALYEAKQTGRNRVHIWNPTNS